MAVRAVQIWLMSGYTFFMVFHGSSVARTLPDDWREYVDADMMTADTGQSRYSSELWEGDIIGVIDLKENEGGGGGGDVDNPYSLWPNNTVPYDFTTQRSAGFSASEKRMVEEAMEIIMHYTGNCIKFVARTNESDYVKFQKGLHCLSNIGRTGQKQVIQLTSSCMRHYGCIQHELMHTLGFYHEQSRSDRDDYVIINWDNIAEADQIQFQKRNRETYGLPYDYQSILHYELKAFAKDSNFPAIIPKTKGMRIGQNENLSPLDLTRIFMRFKCNVPTGIDFALTKRNGSASNTTTQPGSGLSLTFLIRQGNQNLVFSLATDSSGQIQATPHIVTLDSTPTPGAPDEHQDRLSDPESYFYELPDRPYIIWTARQCKRQRSEHCSPYVHQHEHKCSSSYSFYDLHCTEETTPEEFAAVVAAIARPPVRDVVMNFPDNENFTGKHLQPISQQVLSFEFYGLKRRATGRLMEFGLANLVAFHAPSCTEDLNIRRTDFNTSRKLRLIIFGQCGISSLEVDSFSYLIDLRTISLEYYATSTNKQRIHCDQTFAWYRAWISENPYLIQDRAKGSLYDVGGFINYDYEQSLLYPPFNCSQ